MTKAEIIAELYSSQEMADALAKMNPEDLREDLRQEIFVALCEMDDSRIITLHTNKQLKFFAVRIMLNMIQSKTSRFFYKFRRGAYDPYHESHDKAEDEPECEETFSKRYEAVCDELGTMYWYKRELFRLYVESGCNAAKVSRETKIPIRSVYHTIKEVKDQIKNRV